MWILKIGGSWITSNHLNELIDLLKKKALAENLILVVGGGCFADSVRWAFKKKKMSMKTANYLALKSTEIFAYMLKEIDQDIQLIKNIKSLKKKGNLKVWLPSKLLKDEPSFLKNWDSTSDSVAAWLYETLNAKGLLFIKSLKLTRKIYNLKYLQDQKIIDQNVGKYILKKKDIRIVGPEIIGLLKKPCPWKETLLQMKEIEF